ncbi:hypothetical protein HBI25_006070 [Parastagonospora nodorum]|nr:hypothetical protein HBI73_006800 [Parastagonospora nodorum]KAH5575993.1 hypothetical protein HBI25_006070 [Parastagonospora nodorum]KAH6035790.1 hypothetical protein HBI82_025170 [Parastagonospora nodorum]KAH6167846.1 hypothetical protein HBI68_093510 [Parastagonospora nodorum]KAH6232991.1 hypothetical protein HBI43_022270 [Parastagonospora nodorum]
MTQTGKCDICRQRKVKCDEEKPKCGACRKKDRPCSYSYGKASAFVVEDPNQLTKHGRAKVAPVIHTLEDAEESMLSSTSTPSNLHVTTERDAGNGQGFFQTLAPLSKRKAALSRKAVAQQRRKLELYIQHLQAEAALSIIKPSCPETTLIARYINMVGPENVDYQPLSILGTWIQSIPSRIGSNRMMDLAVEFFVNSFDVYWDDTHSKRNLAIASKEKALKELQLFVFNANNRPTYDVLLATKMHYAAEAMLGLDSMYHAIHAFGLAELLKSGVIASVDDEHYWNLIDNTYIDDVNEAMLGGRDSVYDNDFYLSTTYPPPLSSHQNTLSASQRASMVIMHIFVQCPRFNRVVRHAIANQDDTAALVAAVTLAESLWQLEVPAQVAPLLSEAVALSPRPVNGLADTLVNSLQFSSVQSMVLCTRYWMLVSILGGLIDTLYRYFPAETELSMLPDRYALHKFETEAATKLAMSIPWADSLSQKLPLVPLRLHTPLQISIGPWHRTIQRLNAFRASTPNLDTEIDCEMSRTISHAERMKAWIIRECNQIHEKWDVSVITEGPLLEALNTMAGEKIPDWLPVRVRFEAEDGDMVLKLEYENKEGSYKDSFHITENPPRRAWENQTLDWLNKSGFAISTPKKEMPYRGESHKDSWYGTERAESMEPRDAANFVHGTGRNLCSSSGWWPTNDNASTILLDSTHKASAFSTMPHPSSTVTQDAAEHVDRHPCLASSFWPQMSNSMTALLGGSPKNPCLSPAWSGPLFSASNGNSTNAERNRLSPVYPDTEHFSSSPQAQE